MPDYDSTADTLRHSLRVGELIGEVVTELVARSTQHDRSKTEPPELDVFNEFTPKLKTSTYGSDEYKGFLAAMGEGLAHHYANNRHHPEFVDRNVEWRPVAGYEGHYEVSSHGDVRSVDRTVSRSGPTGDVFKSGANRKAQVTPKGYLRLGLVLDGVQRNHMVHRLVAEAFIPNPDAKPEVNHRNGNKSDNGVTNLEWSTGSENQIHAYETGLKEPAVKYVVHCPELDLTTFGTQAMERKLQDLGYTHAAASGIWSAMDRGGKHLDLTFEGTALAEYRRSQVNGMTLADLIEMLADWKAATERMADGDLARSLHIQRERFDLSEQLFTILSNTAAAYGWVSESAVEDLGPVPPPPVPAHLVFQRTDRGFAHLPELHGRIGCEAVRVYESSLATEACIWLNATSPQDRNRPHPLLVNDVTIELDLETAGQLRDQLDWLIANHYQIRD